MIALAEENHELLLHHLLLLLRTTLSPLHLIIHLDYQLLLRQTTGFSRLGSSAAVCGQYLMPVSTLVGCCGSNVAMSRRAAAAVGPDR